MTQDNHADIISALDRKIEDATGALAAAKQAALDVPALEAELSRLETARKALASPQTPAGRQRIAEGQRRRKKKAESEPAAAPVCAECKGFGTMGQPTLACNQPGCDAVVCGACKLAHDARWHSEVA